MGFTPARAAAGVWVQFEVLPDAVADGHVVYAFPIVGHARARGGGLFWFLELFQLGSLRAF
jgi:hypothetical protein